MTLISFQEIKRYLKISNFLTDKETHNIVYWLNKIKLLLIDFLKASKKHLTFERNVSIDEQLKSFRKRF